MLTQCLDLQLQPDDNIAIRRDIVRSLKLQNIKSKNFKKKKIFKIFKEKVI